MPTNRYSLRDVQTTDTDYKSDCRNNFNRPRTKLKLISKKWVHCGQFPVHDRYDCPAKKPTAEFVRQKSIILAFTGTISQESEK